MAEEFKSKNLVGREDAKRESEKPPSFFGRLAKLFTSPVTEMKAAKEQSEIDSLIDGLPRSGKENVEKLVALGEKAVPQLVKTLCEYDMIRSGWAADALSRMGESAVAHITLMLTNESSVARQNAAGALELFGPKAASAIPALKKVAESDPYPGTKDSAARALRRIGPASSDSSGQQRMV